MLNINIKKKIFTEKGSMDLAITAKFKEETISVVYGNSGEGKSTLFNIISGIAKPDTGTISFKENTWFDKESGINLPIQKRNISYIFQNSSLFPHMTVIDNINYAIPASKTKQNKIEKTLNKLGLSKMLDKYPNELSGGQKQRAAIARALLQESNLILMDEPFSGLDIETKFKLYNEIKKISKEFGLTILVITHDINDVFNICQEVFWMKNHIIAGSIKTPEFKKIIEEKIKKYEATI